MSGPKEALAMRAFTQGALAMSTQTHFPIPVELAQGVDQAGNYLPYFTLTTQSGIVLRVTVEVESA